MAKINEISADFILVGSVEDFSIEEKLQKFIIRSRNKKNGSYIYLSYRLLDCCNKNRK